MTIYNRLMAKAEWLRRKESFLLAPELEALAREVCAEARSKLPKLITVTCGGEITEVEADMSIIRQEIIGGPKG